MKNYKSITKTMKENNRLEDVHNNRTTSRVHPSPGVPRPDGITGSRGTFESSGVMKLTLHMPGKASGKNPYKTSNREGMRICGAVFYFPILE